MPFLTYQLPTEPVIFDWPNMAKFSRVWCNCCGGVETKRNATRIRGKCGRLTDRALYGVCFLGMILAWWV